MFLKKCVHCNKYKHLSLFSKDKQAKDGCSSWCKSCKREYDIDYRKNNHDKRLSWQRDYAEEQRKHVRNWQRNNREKVVSMVQNRRARIAGNGGTYTEKEWKSLVKKTGNVCLCCQESGNKVTLTPDHIVPISKGGLNNIENIQPLCARCNSSKGAKTIDFDLDNGL